MNQGNPDAMIQNEADTDNCNGKSIPHAECANCNSLLSEPVRQSAERNEGTIALHYRCPNCGAGGYRIVTDDDETVRYGGRAFGTTETTHV